MLDLTFNGKHIFPANNSNWPQLDDPGVNAAMAKATLIVDPVQRAKAWGNIDRMITNLAPAIPGTFDKTPNIWSKNVNGVIAKFNASIDVTATSLK